MEVEQHELEQMVKEYLSVPLRLKILRECYLYLFFKMTNNTADITVDKSTVHSSDGTSKTIYTVTVYS